MWRYRRAALRGPASRRTSVGPVIVARALQGFGLALIPVGIANAGRVASRPPGRVALMSATLAIGGAAGPPLAGPLPDAGIHHRPGTPLPSPDRVGRS